MQAAAKGHAKYVNLAEGTSCNEASRWFPWEIQNSFECVKLVWMFLQLWFWFQFFSLSSGEERLGDQFS
jgi:hypothetical protein